MRREEENGRRRKREVSYAQSTPDTRLARANTRSDLGGVTLCHLLSRSFSVTWIIAVRSCHISGREARFVVYLNVCAHRFRLSHCRSYNYSIFRPTFSVVRRIVRVSAQRIYFVSTIIYAIKTRRANSIGNSSTNVSFSLFKTFLKITRRKLFSAFLNEPKRNRVNNSYSS